MESNRPIRIACVVLLVGVVLSWALRWHLRSATVQGPTPPRSKLVELPKTFDCSWKPYADSSEVVHLQWVGDRHPLHKVVEEQVAPFADEFIFRSYRPLHKGKVIGYPVDVYVVHSKQGKDREHHPEICIRDVNGVPEDLTFRKMLFLDDAETRPVQRFRFQATGSSDGLVFYYWHYTFPPRHSPSLSRLQELHNEHGWPRASVTVQVSTRAPVKHLPLLEQTFLTAIDRALQEQYLPEGCRTGCHRSVILNLQF